MFSITGPRAHSRNSMAAIPQAEIKAIVKKRKEHEFALARRISKKSDFVRYIDYEVKLEQLRRKRKDRILAALAATGPDRERPVWKRSVSDHSIGRRIHYIYDRALRKFSGDVDLWLQYFTWAESVGASKALSRAYARAIQLHPAKPVFWIRAATWELEDNTNVGAARILLQRAIRMNPELIQLWHEYFKLELRYLDKVKRRREILFGKKAGIGGLEVAEKAKEDDDESMDEAEDGEDDGVIKLPGGSGDAAGKATAPTAEETEASRTPSVTEQAFFDGAIPKIVYRNAIKAIPKDLAFRMKFVELFRLAELESGVEEVIESIRRDFGADPSAVEALARDCVHAEADDPAFPAQLKEAVGIFQKALDNEPSGALYGKFSGFLRRIRSGCSEKNLIKYLGILISRTCRAAEAAGLLDDRGFVEWAKDDGSIKEGKDDSASIVARGLAAHPRSVILHGLKLEQALINGSLAEASNILKESLRSVDRAESWPLWERYLDALVATGEDNDDIADAFKQATGREGVQNTPDEDAAVAKYLAWAKSVGGLSGVREAIDGLIKAKARGAVFYGRCLAAELDEASKDSDGEDEEMSDGSQWPLDPSFDWRSARWTGGKADLVRCRRYLEAACDASRRDGDIWLAYVKFELVVGKSVGKASAVYDRATRVVGDRDSFDQKYLVVRSSV